MIIIEKPENKDDWIPAYLYRDRLEKQLEYDPQEVDNPVESWFNMDHTKSLPMPTGLYLAKAVITNGKISFELVSGRSRTQWLLQSKLEHIPVYLTHNGYHDALQTELIYMRGFYDERIYGLNVILP